MSISTNTSISEDSKDNNYEFSSFEELYDYVMSVANESKKCTKLPLYLDQLFKYYNLYNTWDTSTEINEDVVEILLHLKIELRENSYPQNMTKIIQQEIDVINNLSEKFGFVMKIAPTKELKERTDKNIIPDSKIKCLDTSIQLMNSLIKNEQIANEHNDVVFGNARCQPANKTLKTNCYGLDRLGIVINRKFFNSKSKPFSWKYLNGTTTPISYFYDPVLSDDENINRILAIQYQLQPSAFTKPSGVIYKIYSNDKDLYPRYLDFINMKQLDNK